MIKIIKMQTRIIQQVQKHNFIFIFKDERFLAAILPYSLTLNIVHLYIERIKVNIA